VKPLSDRKQKGSKRMIHAERHPSSSSRRAFWARSIAIIVGFLVVGSFVIVGSRAAFTATTDNTTNALGAGTVTLTDDDLGSAMFNITNMVPGDTVESCILVTYSGTVVNPAAVKLYSGGYTDSGNFDTYLDIVIEEGDDGTPVFDDCTRFVADATIETGGTLSDFDTAHTNYGNGAGVWDPAGTPESKSYRFEFTLDAATPNAEQGESVTALIFTWEVSS
jgi:hypothetical protein